MIGENEDLTLHNLKICRAIIDESIETYHGRVFGSAGDSLMSIAAAYFFRGDHTTVQD